MTFISPNKTGLVLGALLGIWHALWALLVALGWAQAVIDFVFWMHFMKPLLVVGPFNASTALVLIGITASMGYGTGFVFGLVWNRFHR